MPNESRLEKTIEEHGWASTGTHDKNGRLFTYTVGFNRYFNHPDILIVGIEPHMAHALFHNTIIAIKECGEAFTAGDVCAQIIEDKQGCDFKVKFVEVSDFVKKEFMCQAGFHYGKNFEALQMMWPDSSGRLPEELDYDCHSQLLCERDI